MIVVSTYSYSVFLFDLEDRQIIECKKLIVKKLRVNGCIDYELSSDLDNEIDLDDEPANKLLLSESQLCCTKRLEEVKIEILDDCTKKITMLGPFFSMLVKRIDFNPLEDLHRFQVTFIVTSAPHSNEKAPQDLDFTIQIKLRYI